MQVTAGCIASLNVCSLNNRFYCVENGTFLGAEMVDLSGFVKAAYFSITSLLLEELFV